MSYQEFESYLNYPVSEQFQKLEFHLLTSENVPEKDPIIGVYLPLSTFNKIKEVVDSYFETLQTNRLNLQIKEELI